MGRKKKNVALEEIPKVHEKAESNEDRQLKKWEKVMEKAFEKKIKTDELYDKLYEEFQSDQEIKNIINELYIKIKNCEYSVKKQWHTLRKFNLLEKIHQEESKIISQNEMQKLNEIYHEAIEKLSACHMSGFEPLNIIRSKVLSKLQKKYSINESNMKELSSRFNASEEEDENLNKKRNEEQLAALKKIVSMPNLFNYKDVDKATYLNTKAEIKKYEKELELKATQTEIIEEKIDQLPTIGSKELENKNGLLLNFNTKKAIQENDVDMLIDEDEQKIRISDFINKPNVSYEDSKKSVIESLSHKITNIQSFSKEYKSHILNDFCWKIKNYGKLSDYDIQILLYIFLSVTSELISSKNTKKDYGIEISPTELMDFLKKFQINFNDLTGKENPTDK